LEGRFATKTGFVLIGELGTTAILTLKSIEDPSLTLYVRLIFSS